MTITEGGLGTMTIPIAQLVSMGIRSRRMAPTGNWYGINFAIVAPSSVASNNAKVLARVQTGRMLDGGWLELNSVPNSQVTVQVRVRAREIPYPAEYLLVDPHLYGMKVLSAEAGRLLEEQNARECLAMGTA